MNTLAAVLAGLVVLREWQAAHQVRLLVATAPAIGGGVPAAASAR